MGARARSPASATSAASTRPRSRWPSGGATSRRARVRRVVDQRSSPTPPADGPASGAHEWRLRRDRRRSQYGRGSGCRAGPRPCRRAAATTPGRSGGRRHRTPSPDRRRRRPRPRLTAAAYPRFGTSTTVTPESRAISAISASASTLTITTPPEPGISPTCRPSSSRQERLGAVVRDHHDGAVDAVGHGRYPTGRGWSRISCGNSAVSMRSHAPKRSGYTRFNFVDRRIEHVPYVFDPVICDFVGVPEGEELVGDSSSRADVAAVVEQGDLGRHVVVAERQIPDPARQARTPHKRASTAPGRGCDAGRATARRTGRARSSIRVRSPGRSSA